MLKSSIKARFGNEMAVKAIKNGKKQYIADKGVNKRTLIDSFMRFSRIRKKIGSGNWSALNKSGKQLYNDIPLQFCKERGIEEYDE
jgi:hypothetical protein